MNLESVLGDEKVREKNMETQFEMENRFSSFSLLFLFYFFIVNPFHSTIKGLLTVLCSGCYDAMEEEKLPAANYLCK